MSWKTLVFAVVASGAGAFAQTPAAGTRIPEVVAIGGQLANGAYVMAATGSVQSYVCPQPQAYVTADGKQGWACFDPATGVWLLGALPPPAPPAVASIVRPPVVENFFTGASEDIVAPPQVIYVEAPPRVVYVEAPPRVVYVEPPSQPDVVYVQSPPNIIVVEVPVRRPTREREQVEPEPSGFAVAPVYTNAPAFVSRPAFANPGVPAAPADDRRRRDGDRDRDRDGTNATEPARTDAPARGR